MQKYILFIVLIVASNILNAQGKIGSWKDYLSYNNASKIAISPEKIFCVTEGGLFYFDIQDNSVNKSTFEINLSIIRSIFREYPSQPLKHGNYLHLIAGR